MSFIINGKMCFYNQMAISSFWLRGRELYLSWTELKFNILCGLSFLLTEILTTFLKCRSIANLVIQIYSFWDYQTKHPGKQLYPIQSRGSYANPVAWHSILGVLPVIVVCSIYFIGAILCHFTWKRKVAITNVIFHGFFYLMNLGIFILLNML